MSETTSFAKRVIDESQSFTADARQAAANVTDALYVPERVTVPTPNFQSFVGMLATRRVAAQNGFYDIYPAHGVALPVGLRGLASFKVAGNVVTGPAIVGPHKKLIVLLAETVDPAGRIDAVQQMYLEAEYAKGTAQTGDKHSDQDSANVAAIDAALTIASAPTAVGVHDRLHSLSRRDPIHRTNMFGPNLSRTGAHDLIVKGKTRTVLSGLVPPNAARFLTAAHHQIGVEQSLGLHMTADELAVGLTQVAMRSQGRSVPLQDRMRSMVH